jgi:hypothetical protein
MKMTIWCEELANEPGEDLPPFHQTSVQQIVVFMLLLTVSPIIDGYYQY